MTTDDLYQLPIEGKTGIAVERTDSEARIRLECRSLESGNPEKSFEFKRANAGFRDQMLSVLVKLLAGGLLWVTILSVQAAQAAASTVAFKDIAVSIDDISPRLESLRVGANLPALAAAVWQNGQTKAIGTAGFRQYGSKVPVTRADPWHLGSCTKAMTAVLVAVLVDRGTIHFDDTISDLFAGDPIHPGYAPITVRQLLTHTGGAPHDLPPDIWQDLWTNSTPNARTLAVSKLLSRPPEAKPGAFVYSNAGYMVLGAALERLTGKHWEELITKEIFIPLGMTSAGFGAPGSPNQLNAPRGHRVISQGVAPIPVTPGEKSDNPAALGPAGTVHCFLADWGKFLTLVLQGARHERTRLLSQSTFTKPLEPSGVSAYAGGWNVLKRPWAGGDGTALTQAGSNTMWFATAWLAPSKNVCFAVVTNSGDEVARKTAEQAMRGQLLQEKRDMNSKCVCENAFARMAGLSTHYLMRRNGIIE